MATSKFQDLDKQNDAKVLAMEAKLRLIPRAPVRYFMGEETGWANHYGGVEALAAYCGLLPGLLPGFNSAWQHGVHSPWLYRRNAEDLLYYIKHAPDRLILVANDDQKECLSSMGYVNVHAVGLPWVYAQPKVKGARISESVLVVPPHTLDNAPFEDVGQLSDYSDFIALKYREKSSLLCACVHMSCFRNGQLSRPLFDSRIDVITGADHFDANSLFRMWQIFTQFETVSTPVVGSHVFYALSAGCRVVIEGPKIIYSRGQLMKDVSFQRSEKAGIDTLSNPVILDGETQFEKMFELPRANLNLGLEAVGMSSKKSPEQIKHILSWSRRKQVGKLLLRDCPRKFLSAVRANR